MENYEKQKKYLSSEKGKESHKRAQAKYYASEKGKDNQKNAIKRYYQTEKGKQKRKEANARYYAKKRGLIKEETYYYDPVDREYDEYKDHMLEEEFSKNFQ